MADINYLTEKVEKASEKVEKVKKTIERHQRQLEKKLAEAERILQNWKDKLNIAINEQIFIEENAPQVIIDFLEEWKQKAFEWHIQRYDKYQEFKKSLDEQERKTIIEYVEAHPEEFERYTEDGKLADYWVNRLHDVRSRNLAKHLKEKGLDYSNIKAKKNDFAGGTVLEMDTYYNEVERLQWLDKVLEKEKKAKLSDLINRITGIVGKIQDATYLKVSEKGNLDGYVIGDKGKAEVQTIGVGGWNIQCFHYRTLVHEIK